jgi:RNA polymerase sigma-70 factor (ECF subfamily)
MEHQIEDFERWYASTHPRLLSALVVVCGDLDLAREATDEAFVRAFERWSRVSRMAAPEGWTYRVALNLVRRRSRRAKREQQLVRQPAPPPESTWDPDLWAAVRQLPDRERLAVALRYVADLPGTDIAELMGVAPGTVWSTLDNARRHLRAALEGAGPGREAHDG